jgi:hypothetical protein
MLTVKSLMAQLVQAGGVAVLDLGDVLGVDVDDIRTLARWLI